MKLTEITEGRVNQLWLDQQDNRAEVKPTVAEIPLNYYITINGNPWKSGGKIKPFATEKSALIAANSLHKSRPKLSISVLPAKK